MSPRGLQHTAPGESAERFSEPERIYQTLFEHSGTAVAVIEEDKTFSKVNRKFEEMLGYAKEEVEGRLKVPDVVRDRDRGLVSYYHEQRRKDPSSVPKNYELTFVTKSGQERLVDVNVEVIPHSKRSIASLIDITEKRNLEREIRRQEQYLANILMNSTDAILSTDNQTCITSWNKGAEKLLGYKAEEMMGRPIKRLLRKDLLALGEHHRLEKILSERGYVSDYEADLLTKDGMPVTVNSTMNLIYDEQGNRLGISLIMRDITEKKQLEQRLIHNERMSALGELAASLAHEIKNPLNSMVINIEVLKGYLEVGPNAEKIGKYLHVLSSEIKRLDKVIRGVMDFTRPMRMDLRPLDVNHVLEGLILFIGHEAKKSRIEVKTRLDARRPVITGDDDQLRQAFLNLFLNAIQAMPDGGALTVSTQAGRQEISVTVADTGVGIREELLGRVFDLYFSTKEKGSGLGLPIVQRIVRAHNGRVDLRSSPGAGTTFTLTFPARGGRP